MLWKEIHDELLNDVRAGHYAAGEKMPTEAELARRFNVNRHTVRRALGLLRENGFVLSKKGAGVFVTGKMQPIALANGPDFRRIFPPMACRRARSHLLKRAM